MIRNCVNNEDTFNRTWKLRKGIVIGKPIQMKEIINVLDNEIPLETKVYGEIPRVVSNRKGKLDPKDKRIESIKASDKEAKANDGNKRMSIVTEKTLAVGRRFLYPIKYKGLWDICTKIKKNTWFVDSMDFSKCHDNYAKLNPVQKIIVKNGLISATVLEEVINDQLENVLDVFKLNEIKHYIIFCRPQEETHWYGYQKLLFCYLGEKESNKISNYLPKWVVELKKKVSDYFSGGTSISEILLGLVCLEGMLFHETFIIPHALKCENILPTLIALNADISRDENIHFSFWLRVFLMVNTLSDSRMLEIVSIFYKIGLELCIRISKSKDIMKECTVSVEKLDVDEFNSIEGIHVEKMKKHLDFLANDKIKKSIGVKYEKVKTPLKFMNFINLHSRTNFFGKFVPDYVKLIKADNLKIINNF